jgi:DNA-binding transcriptional LysR family regulator
MELRHLRNFMSIADHLNFTRASKYLHLSQPALSRQIKELEAEMGVSLFTRRAAGLELTAAGRFLVKEAKSILQQTDLLLKTIGSFSTQHDDRFSIGYDPGAISQKFFGTLARFGSDHPQIELSIREHSTDQLFAALRSNSVDVAVIPISRHSIPIDCASLIVAQEPLSLVVSSKHALAGNTAVRLTDVADEVLVSYQDDIAPIWNEYVLDACKLAGFKPQRSIRVNSYSSMLGTIAAGKGYGLLPKVLDTNFRQAVTSIPIVHPIVKMDTCAVWRRTLLHCVSPFFLKCSQQAASQYLQWHSLILTTNSLR